MELISILNVKCGEYSFDPILPNIVSMIVTAIKVLIPLILIILGMLDLGKAVMSNDEKVMKESQSRLIKRFVYAIIIFLLVALVQLVFITISGKDENDPNNVSGGITECINCFINGSDECKPDKSGS